MASYQFNKQIAKVNAFDAYMKASSLSAAYGSFGFVPPFQEPIIQINFTRPLTVEEQSTLQGLVESYVDPAYWLNFAYTDNQFLTSDATNSSSLTVVQSFIVSPYNNAEYVMGDLKTIVKLDAADGATFDDWVAGTSPDVTFTLQLFDYTLDQVIQTTTTNINDVIQSWKQGGSDPKWRTLQVYGLKDANPGSDEVWQIKLSVSDPRIKVSLNSIQRIYYTLE